MTLKVPTQWFATLSWKDVISTLRACYNKIKVCLRNYSKTKIFPLREHFSLPFIFWQFLIVRQYLKKTASHSDTYHLVAVFISSLLFTITWQFAQFVLLIQALVLFCLATVDLLDHDQLYQTMVITSLMISLVPII